MNLSLLCCAEKQSPVIPKLQTASEKSCKGKMAFTGLHCMNRERVLELSGKGAKTFQNPTEFETNKFPFRRLRKKTFSDYSHSHSHRSQSLPWNVHIQTLPTKISLFNQCSSNRTITATVSSLSTYGKQCLIIIIMLFAFEIFPSRKDFGKFVLIRFGFKPTRNE